MATDPTPFHMKQAATALVPPAGGRKLPPMQAIAFAQAHALLAIADATERQTAAIRHQTQAIETQTRTLEVALGIIADNH